MKGSVLIPCTKGFLLFVLFQTSLIWYASAQNSTMPSNSTTVPTMTSMPNQTFNSTMAPNNTNTTGTTSMGTNSTMVVSCPLFSCNYSACYSTFTNTNATTCPASANSCELRREGDATYSVRCTNTCLSACTNTSQNNCSINCCNSNNCVNSTLNTLLNSSVIMTTTSTSTTTTTTVATTSTVASTTMATNGKKCHKLSCTGDNCYQSNTNVAMCSPMQNFCMLKKTMSGTVVTWTASCIEDCSKEMVCTTSTSTCILECCNATITASCLKLNGQVNIVGSGTMALCSHVPLMISSFFLWLLMMHKSAD